MPSPNAATTRILSILRGARIFHGLPEPMLEAFAGDSTSAMLAGGELLWRAGQPAPAFTVLGRGLVQIQRLMPSGEEAIVGLFGPRESIGDAAVIGGGNYPASALAVSDEVEIVRVPARIVLHAMNADLAVAHAIQRALLDHTHALQAKIDIVSAGSVAARLATLLLYLAERFGDEDEHHMTRIGISLSRTALSRLVSARVETVIRMLSAWDKQGLLHTDADGFLVPSLDALHSVAQQG